MSGTWEQGVRRGIALVRGWIKGYDRTLLEDEADASHLWRWSLAHNLTIAAGLCAAFRLGRTDGYNEAQHDEDPVNVERGRFYYWDDPIWSPGCHRPAPGWGNG